MRKKLLYTLLVSCLFACSDKDTSYEVVKNDLRAPAYPLVTIDPYASAWSMSDNLYDSPVRHWTGKDFPLIGVVKVDGVSYRFMGTEELEMNAIVPTSQQGDWTVYHGEACGRLDLCGLRRFQMEVRPWCLWYQGK